MKRMAREIKFERIYLLLMVLKIIYKKKIPPISMKRKQKLDFLLRKEMNRTDNRKINKN